MEAELLEIRDFLAAHHPFDQLQDEQLSALPGKLEIRYERRGADVAKIDNAEQFLYMIRTGAVEVRGADDKLLARLGEGDYFGHRASPGGMDEELHWSAIEDTLLYQLPASEVDELCDSTPQFAYFFRSEGGGRLRDAVANLSPEAEHQFNLVTTPVRDIVTLPPVSVAPESTIRAAAELMSERRVSSVLVISRDALVGIVTDRDLRQRVLAKGLDSSVSVSEIMTANPSTVAADTLAFDVLLQMARHNIHHVPVTENGKTVGMVTATDLTQRHSTSAVYLVGDIYKKTSIESIKEAADNVPSLLANLVASETTANTAGHIITTVSDAIGSRLLQMAEQKLGPPPVPYAWVALGSQGRSEQIANSDQDNCIIIDDEYDPEKHAEYFDALTKFVCDGLDACGYVYCPGEMMAMTDQWRQPLRKWREYFSHWIDTPEPKALMLTCVFFDFRCIYGDVELFNSLRQHVLEKTRSNTLFLAHMAGNALSHQPPLGFFRNFVLIKGGEHNHTFDLKHSGVIPIVDLARVYALAAGVEAVNTQDRLATAADGGEVSRDGAQDLSDALEFIAGMRLRHQARQIRGGEKANNFVPPEELSHFERNHLKDAFAVVRTMQSVLASRYHMG
jgi:CBS domain-containing protein